MKSYIICLYNRDITCRHKHKWNYICR